MAVVKLKYTRSRGAIKAHLRYIVHRPGKEWDTPTRELFQHNYLSVTKQYAYDLINAAPRNTIFYKMMINFHPQKEDTYKDLDLHYIEVRSDIRPSECFLSFWFESMASDCIHEE